MTSKLDQTTAKIITTKYECDLNENIYQNLHILTKWKNPSTEFKQIFVKDMFLKSNPKAFLHVMQYLFVILDLKEFKKRFYWPVFDKNSEATFRTTTIAYLNDLKDKHNLQYETVKSHIVVLPGGIKFMRVLIELINLVMKEEIARYSDKYDINRIVSFEEMSVKLAEFKEFVSQQEKYKEILNENTTKMKLIISSLTNEMKYLTKDIVPDVELNELIYGWSERLDAITTDEIEPTLMEINAISGQFKEVDRLATNLIENRRKNIIDFNEDIIIDAWNKLNLSPNQLLPKISIKNQIHFANLFNVFDQMLPGISNMLSNTSFRPIQNLEFELESLQKLYQRSKAIEIKVHSLSICAKPELDSSQNHSIINYDYSPNSQLMTTPMILPTNVAVDNETRRILQHQMTLIDSEDLQKTNSLRPEMNRIDSPNRNKTIKLPTANDILNILGGTKKSAKKRRQRNDANMSRTNADLSSMSYLASNSVNASTPLTEPTIENRQLNLCSTLLTDSSRNNRWLHEDYCATPTRRTVGISPVSVSPSGKITNLIEAKQLFNNSKKPMILLDEKMEEFTSHEMVTKCILGKTIDEIENDQNSANTSRQFANLSSSKDLILDTSDTILNDIL